MNRHSPTPRRAMPLYFAAGVGLLVLTGCARVERTLTVESDPPGALVYLNDQEAGRTPMTKEFLWYGTYDVQLRKEGYRTLSHHPRVWAPLWQVPPFDFLAEFVPFRMEDHHRLSYKMKPAGEEAEPPPDELVARAQDLEGMLESSKYAKPDRPPAE